MDLPIEYLTIDSYGCWHWTNEPYKALKFADECTAKLMQKSIPFLSEISQHEFEIDAKKVVFGNNHVYNNTNLLEMQPIRFWANGRISLPSMRVADTVG